MIQYEKIYKSFVQPKSELATEGEQGRNIFQFFFCMAFLIYFQWADVQQYLMPTLKIEEDQSFKADLQSEESIPCNYSVISYQERIRLIEMVCLEKQQIIHAAPALGIKLSTAKHILKSFRKDGKILRKSQDKIIENQKFGNQLQQLKAKIEEMNRRKKERKEKKAKVNILKSSDFNSKKQGPTHQLIPSQQPQLKKQIPECKTSQQIHLQGADSQVQGQQIIWYMIYNPIWFNCF